MIQSFEAWNKWMSDWTNERIREQLSQRIIQQWTQ